MKNQIIKLFLSPIIVILAAFFIVALVSFLWHFPLVFKGLLYVCFVFLLIILYHAYIYKPWVKWKQLKEYEIKMKDRGYEFFDIKDTKVLARDKKHALKLYKDQKKVSN